MVSLGATAAAAVPQEGSRSVCQHRYGCSCFVMEAGMHGGAARPLALPEQSGAFTISSPCKEDWGRGGNWGGGGGLLRNGKKASSFPGPRPNFLQKSCTLQTSGLLRQEAGAGGSLSCPRNSCRRGTDPGFTRREPIEQPALRLTHCHTSTSSARWPPRRACAGPGRRVTPRGCGGSSGAALSRAAHRPEGRWGSSAGRGLRGRAGV